MNLKPSRQSSSLLSHGLQRDRFKKSYMCPKLNELIYEMLSIVSARESIVQLFCIVVWPLPPYEPTLVSVLFMFLLKPLPLDVSRWASPLRPLENKVFSVAPLTRPAARDSFLSKRSSSCAMLVVGDY